MKLSIKLLSAILVVLTLAGCGLKGPLYSPSEKDNASTDSYSLNKTA